jgi:hypothetical protein
MHSSTCETIRFVYHWREGSVPPLEHYAITIEGETSDRATISLVPGYPAEGHAAWVETFNVDPLRGAAFEDFVRTKDLLNRPWLEVKYLTVGGSTRSFCLGQGSQQVEIPTHLSPVDRAVADALEPLVRALVPDSVWQGVRAARLTGGPQSLPHDRSSCSRHHG